eukprot:3242494-Amphidinium_carterae.2
MDEKHRRCAIMVRRYRPHAHNRLLPNFAGRKLALAPLAFAERVQVAPPLPCKRATRDPGRPLTPTPQSVAARGNHALGALRQGCTALELHSLLGFQRQRARRTTMCFGSVAGTFLALCQTGDVQLCGRPAPTHKPFRRELRNLSVCVEDRRRRELLLFYYWTCRRLTGGSRTTSRELGQLGSTPCMHSHKYTLAPRQSCLCTASLLSGLCGPTRHPMPQASCLLYPASMGGCHRQRVGSDDRPPTPEEGDFFD